MRMPDTWLNVLKRKDLRFPEYSSKEQIEDKHLATNWCRPRLNIFINGVREGLKDYLKLSYCFWNKDYAGYYTWKIHMRINVLQDVED